MYRLENNLLFSLGKFITLYNSDIVIDRSLEDLNIFRKSPSQSYIHASKIAHIGVLKTEAHINKL